MSQDFHPWAGSFGLNAPACGRWLFCGNGLVTVGLLPFPDFGLSIVVYIGSFT
jgi:hypothetical protein